MIQATTAAIRQQAGLQNLKHRLMRVGIAEGAVLTAIDGPPTSYQHWLAIALAAFGGWWTSAERRAAEVPPKK